LRELPPRKANTHLPELVIVGDHPGPEQLQNLRALDFPDTDTHHAEVEDQVAAMSKPVDKLRGKEADFHIPELIVVCDEKSGKSSLMSAIKELGAYLPEVHLVDKKVVKPAVSDLEKGSYGTF
jgi:hypothetical protein